jgi:hypothetical protein
MRKGKESKLVRTAKEAGIIVAGVTLWSMFKACDAGIHLYYHIMRINHFYDFDDSDSVQRKPLPVILHKLDNECYN